MGIKDRRTQILLTLKLLGSNDKKPISISPPISEAFDVELNRKTTSALYQLVLDNCVGKINQNESELYFLTAQGDYEIYLRFPFFRFIDNEWDCVFRILSYEIPEKKRELRDRLRRAVSGWGLGPWHRSFWVTPHPIIPALRKLVSEKEEEKYIQGFEADHVFGNEDILIEKVWNTKEVESEYKKVFKKWHEILSGPESNLKKMSMVIANYVDVLNIDPGLPEKLLGKQWIGFEAFKIFNEIKDILLEKKLQ